jgi:hypothetical protein
MLSAEFAYIFRGNVATGILPVKPPQRRDLNQLASLIPRAVHLNVAMTWSAPKRYVLVEATRTCWLASLAIRRGRREFRE